jgi:nitroreductase
MNEALKVFKERRSIRRYKDEQITEEQLKQILEAGEYAPSAMGNQSAIMVVVQKKELIQRLSKLNAKFTGAPDSDPFYGAPTVIVVLADSEKITSVENGSLVMGNLMNAAYAIGVNSCWIHRAKEMFESEEGHELLKEWGIKDSYVGIGSCILGYYDSEYPEARPRKEGRVIRV